MLSRLTPKTIVTDCVSRLGNLCLLTEARNRGAGRASFVDKKATFTDSDLLTTKQVAECPMGSSSNHSTPSMADEARRHRLEVLMSEVDADQLRSVIEAQHGCPAQLVETVSVTVLIQG